MAQAPRRPRRIGILGGMGPSATVVLMQRLIDAVDARDDAGHIPLLVDQNTQVPSRIKWLVEGEGESPEATLVAMAQRLERAGASALAMPCNTAHAFAEAIRNAVAIPLLDMVALTCARAAAVAGPGARVGVLASPALVALGVYERALAGYGLDARHLTDADAALDVIRGVKAGEVGAGQRQRFRALSQGLLDAGASVQLIACSEFSIIAEAASPRAIAFDALDCLVEGIVDFAYRRRGDGIAL